MLPISKPTIYTSSNIDDHPFRFHIVSDYFSIDDKVFFNRLWNAFVIHAYTDEHLSMEIHYLDVPACICDLIMHGASSMITKTVTLLTKPMKKSTGAVQLDYMAYSQSLVITRQDNSIKATFFGDVVTDGPYADRVIIKNTFDSLEYYEHALYAIEQ